MEAKEDLSFGVIPVFKDAHDNVLFCLVHHAAGHWSFPKGHRDENESEEQTAMRELKEETGIVVNNLASEPVFIEKYLFDRNGVRYDKSVKYFLALVGSSDANTPADFKKEIPDVKWLGYEEAKNSITFPEAKEILDQVLEYLGAL